MAHAHSHDVEMDTPRGKQQAKALKTVSIIKGVMFIVESVSGYFAHSASMIADSVDMLEDALGATASVIVRRRSERAQAGVALAKAGIMGALGLSVLGGAAFALLNPVTLPVTTLMFIVGGVALIANGICAATLYRFRNDNINMKASWKCLRNDMLSNAGVLLAAGISRFCVSALPDLIIGCAVAALCVKSAIEIACEAIPILRRHKKDTDKGSKKQKPSRGPGIVPKIALGFKNVLRTVFRKAATAPAAKVIAAAPEVPVVTTENKNNLSVQAGSAPTP